MTASQETYEGSCQCGRVRYRVRGPIAVLANCHCTDCRKNSGAAFVTWAEFPRSAFTFVKGEDQLQTHKAESGTQRQFCRTCGSSLICFVEGDGLIEVTAATFDTPLEERPAYHIYVRSKVPWFDIQDGKPQHQTTRRPQD